MICRFLSLFFLFGLASAVAQSVDERLAEVRVRVTDDSDVPVVRARVVVSTYNGWVPGRKGAGRDDYSTATGATDTNGVVSLSLKGSSGRYACMVLPLPEFHFDRGRDYVFTNSAAGKWEPWGPVVPIVLKRKARDYAPVSEAERGPAKPGADVSKDPLVSGPADARPPGRP
jgi:hypothetical protein